MALTCSAPLRVRRRVFDAYAQRKGVAADALHFRFKGQLLTGDQLVTVVIARALLLIECRQAHSPCSIRSTLT